MKAPVGLLSDRTVLRQQDGGASPRQVPVCRTSCLKQKPERSSLFRVDRSGFYVILKIVLRQLGFQTLPDGFDEALAVHGSGGDAFGQAAQVLGHDAIVQGLQAGSFQCLAELQQLRQIIQLTALLECAGPCKDGGHGVGGGLLTPVFFARFFTSFKNDRQAFNTVL